MLYYVNDPSLHAARNAAGEDYTPAYIPAMLKFMGMTGKEIAPDAMSTLTKDDVVLVGDICAEATDATVILLGTSTPARRRTVYATYHTQSGFDVPLFVPILVSSETPDEVLAYATSEGKQLPALIRCGKNYQFLFDLPATLWFSGDGFMEMQNDPYFPIGRTPDWRPLPNGQYGTHPFNDLLLLELEAILRACGVASLYRLPPTEDGRVPDMVLHFSGDDDCCSATINTNAAARMKQQALPYHINAMPNGADQFCFDTAVLNNLRENGCELGMHLDLTCQPYTEETVKKQISLFCEAFGMHPVTNVNHCLVQHGTQAEFLRWLQNCGIIADNGYLGTFDPNDINAFDLQEFGYGTSFPRYTCDDAAHGNAPLSCMLIPITYYEARLPNEDSETTKIINYLDAAAANARITQFFFHPHYLNDDNSHCAAALRAIGVMKEHIAARGYLALPMTTNTIAQFWKARAEATVVRTDDRITVSTATPVLLRLAAAVDTVLLDGNPVAVEKKTVEGAPTYLVAIPAGVHEIAIEA